MEAADDLRSVFAYGAVFAGKDSGPYIDHLQEVAWMFEPDRIELATQMRKITEAKNGRPDPARHE